MKIADLQEHLRNLDPFFRKACARDADDFERMGKGLEPFRALTVAEFADFLVRAEDYARTGIVPTKAKRARTPAAPRKSAEEAVKEALQLVCSLYEKALDADFPSESVDWQIATLNTLTIPQLKEVAKELPIADVPKKKVDILNRIAREIKERREFHDRARMTGGEPLPTP